MGLRHWMEAIAQTNLDARSLGTLGCLMARSGAHDSLFLNALRRGRGMFHLVFCRVKRILGEGATAIAIAATSEKFQHTTLVQLFVGEQRHAWGKSRRSAKRWMFSRGRFRETYGCHCRIGHRIQITMAMGIATAARAVNKITARKSQSRLVLEPGCSLSRMRIL
jgi:hypothetical protein